MTYQFFKVAAMAAHIYFQLWN